VWETLEVPLETTFAQNPGQRDPDPNRPFSPGDRLTYVQIRVLGAGEAAPVHSYVDDVELVEILDRR
jgi:hypothetical protein